MDILGGYLGMILERRSGGLEDTDVPTTYVSTNLNRLAASCNLEDLGEEGVSHGHIRWWPLSSSLLYDGTDIQDHSPLKHHC